MTSDSSSFSRFTLSYKGTALADHSMSVKELGPALVAMGDLFGRSNYLIYGDSASVDLKVTATRPSSLDIDLIVEMVRVSTTMLGDRPIGIFCLESTTIIFCLEPTTNNCAVFHVIEVFQGR